jgi:hypothetical protein
MSNYIGEHLKQHTCGVLCFKSSRYRAIGDLKRTVFTSSKIFNGVKCYLQPRRKIES